MKIKIGFIFVILLALGGSAFAQGYRFDSQISQELLTTQITNATNVLTVPSGTAVSFCAFPANAVPCTNKATTYTSVTLGTSCPTSTQITLTNTNTCVASPDAQGNWGVWVPAGQYSYTITIAGVNYGPYVVNFGVPSGTNLSLGALTTTGPNSLGGITTVSNLNSSILMDGTVYPFTGVGLQAALTAAGANGEVQIPANTTVVVGAGTTFTLSSANQTIRGKGYGSAISYSGVSTLFNLNASGIKFSNILFTSTSISSRTGVCLINYQAGAGTTTMEDLAFQGAATIDNGIIFCERTIGSGTFDYDHIKVFGAGTPTWTSVLESLGSGTTTIPNTTVNDLVVGGVNFSDAGLIADTLTDTWQVSNSVIAAASGNAVNVRNAGAAQAPRWIHFTNTFLECGGNTSPYTGLVVSAGRDVEFSSDGYIASCQTGANISGGVDIRISQSNFVNIGQNAVNISSTSAALVDISNNFFDDTSNAATNTTDTVLVAAGVTNFNISGNIWRQVSGNVPRYAINIAAGASNELRIVGNDTSAIAFGTAAINNGASGGSQLVLGNSGIADFNKNSAGSSVVTALVAGTLGTQSNCNPGSAISPTACGSAPSGTVVVPTTTATYTVNTTAVTANSRITILPITDATGLTGAPTCNPPPTPFVAYESGRTAGVSFSFTLPSTTGASCWTFNIIN